MSNKPGYKTTEIGEIPEEWDVVRLERILKEPPKYGITTSAKDRPVGPRFLRTTDIKDYNVDWHSLLYCECSPEDFEKYRLRRGDVVIARAGTFGVSILIEEDKNVVYGSYMIRIRPRDNITNLKYFFYFLQSDFYWKQISLGSLGSTLKNINTKTLRNLVILLPSYSEQHKIASILSTVDDAIQKTDEIISKAQELKKGLMQQLLNKGIGHTKFKQREIGEIPEEWEVEPLENVCTIIVDCPHSTPKFAESGVLIIRNFNIREGELDLKSTYFTTEEEWIKRTKRCIPKNGDVLFSREAPIGEACLAQENTRFSLGQRTMLFRPNEKLLNSQFLVYAIYSSLVQRQLRNLEAGVTAHHVNVADIRRLKMPIPKLDEQHKIASILSTIAEKMRTERQRKEQLEKLKKGLMQDLLTGKVRVKVN